MDPYANYVSNLRSRGMSDDQIRESLTRAGLDTHTIDTLIPRSPSMQEQQSARQPAPAEEPPIQQTSPAEAYLDYMKTLAVRGLSPDAINQDLMARGLDEPTRRTLFQALAQTAPAVSYPPQLTKHTNGTLGQAPITFTTTGEGGVDDAVAKPPGALSGWLLTLFACLIPTLFIMFDAPGRFSNSTHVLLTIGDISATIGLCLYVIDMVLATRLARIENLFGGLNKVYIAHAIIGSAALTAILIHPVLLALRYAPLGMHSVAAFFVPTMKYVSNAFGIFAVIMMLVLLVITFYIHLPYKLWLATHKYLGVAYLLICVHVLFTPNVITNNLFIRLYLIMFVLIGLVAYVYRTLLPNIFVRRYIYVVASAVEKTKGVIEVTLKPTSKAMHFQAGQFIFISFHADGLSPEWHPFTVVSPPGNDALSIDVKSLGGYTETITRLLPGMVGMSAMIEGAYGRFSFRNFRNLNQVWIAGGIGITPFLSMAQKLGNGPYNIDLYYSVKSETELIDLDKLASAQINQPDRIFRVIPFVTEKYNRFLSADLIKATTPDLLQRDFLICGPPIMMNSMKKQLMELGVKKYRVHTEEFSIT